MENPPPSPHQNALTLEEYESLTSARAEFVDFLLSPSGKATDDGGKAADDGGKAADDGGKARERGAVASSAGNDGSKAVAESRQESAE